MLGGEAREDSARQDCEVEASAGGASQHRCAVFSACLLDLRC